MSLQQSLLRKENTQGILKMDKSKAMVGLVEDDWDPDADKLLKAVDNQNLDAVRILLAKGVHISAYGGSFRETALHRAAQGCWMVGVEFLVMGGASLYAKNQFGQTPLHYAAAARSMTCIKILVGAGCPGIVDPRDIRGHTPLHDAASSACVETLALLVKAGALVQAKDGDGETPLHKAAKASSIPCMIALLNAGADLSAVKNDGESVLSYMMQHQLGSIDMLFDNCLNTNSPKMNTKSFEVSMNFVPLASCFTNQVQVLKSLVDMGQGKLLCHPLCEMFLLLKWTKVKWLFLIEVMFYFMYTIFTTVITFNKFVWSTPNVNLSKNSTEREQWWDHHYREGISPITPMPNWLSEVFRWFVLCHTIILVLQQIMSIMQNKWAWFCELCGFLHVAITVLVLAVHAPCSVPHEWQHHMATWLMLIIWMECMVLIGRFPNSGIYVAMFTRVARVFVRIFLIFFCLLVAFTSAFYVALHHYPDNTSEEEEHKCNKTSDEEGLVFANPLLTFTKTLTMMIGELDFGNEFVISLNHLVFTGHFIFLIFVILVSIILSNLLVALAVSDVQGLRNSAHLERLIQQMQLAFQMEKNFATISYLTRYIQSMSKKNNSVHSWVGQLMAVAATPGIRLNTNRLQEMLGKVPYVMGRHDFDNTKAFVRPNHPKKANTLFLMDNNKMKEVHIPSDLLKKITECIRLRDTQAQDTNSGTSNYRRSGYQFKEQDSMKLSIKELETNVMEMVSEKVHEVLESNKACDKRLEEKLDKLMELLGQRNTVEETPKASGSRQPS